MFEGFPEKHWTKYKPEQNLISIIRDVLPETAEWRSVRIQIVQGAEYGDDFDKAIGRVRFFIQEFTPRAAKLAIHKKASQPTSKVTAAPGVPSSGKTEEEKKAANDRAALDPDAECYGCGAKGHKSNWWGCPKYEENKKKRNEARKEARRGKGSNHESQGRDESGSKFDMSKVRCFQCLEFGHMAKDCKAGNNQTQYANPATPEGGPLYHTHGAGAGYGHYGGDGTGCAHHHHPQYPQHQQYAGHPPPAQSYHHHHHAPPYNLTHDPKMYNLPAAPHLPQPHLPKKWFPKKEGTEMMPASVHMRQQQSGPMQALQRNMKRASNSAPPPGAWNKGYSGHPNDY